MTQGQILEKAIQKAIDGGLTGYWADRYRSCVERGELEYLTDGNNIEHGQTVEALIFNHDFAKALWGTELHSEEYDTPYPRFPDAKKLDIKPLCQYHLQQMVISEGPIQYLGENI